MALVLTGPWSNETQREEQIKLYVCWGTFQVPGAREHPCREAYRALEQAGFEPEVVKTHSFGALPMALQTPSRKHVAENTGSPWVPALETDDGEWISGSGEIVDWASSQTA
ncbi:MAG: hypothetical protein KDB62_04970 [Solirubrobacterales bacterium]|nr:hypothetical protein [Solirubrobacterales bacterium]